jgi:hypothetical protein
MRSARLLVLTVLHLCLDAARVVAVTQEHAHVLGHDRVAGLGPLAALQFLLNLVLGKSSQYNPMGLECRGCR